MTDYVASAVCSAPNILAAAAVGAVAVAGQPAAADIILNTNPLTIPVPRLSVCGSFGSCFGMITVPWSFDGGNKFSFQDAASHGAKYYNTRGALRLYALSGDGFLAGPLAKGARVGPGGAFTGFSLMAYEWGPSAILVDGLWVNKSGYLGFEFTGSGGLQYGWAYLTVNFSSGFEFSGVISEFAYDTVPGQSIEAGQTASTPEPGTLGLLALGSLALGFWRRRKAVTSDK